MDEYIPDTIIERSFAFKTIVVILGALLVLVSSLLRPKYPVLWIPVFAIGALVEWLIVATVYVEMNDIESEISDAQSEIEEAVKEIEETQREIENTQREIESTKEDIFSFISDSQGGTTSLEDRISKIETEVGVGRRAGSRGLKNRISKLEDQLKDIERRRRF